MAIPKGVTSFNGASPSEVVEGKSGGKRNVGKAQSGGSASRIPARKTDGSQNRGTKEQCIRGNVGVIDTGVSVKQPFAPSGIKAKTGSVKDPSDTGGLMSHE